MFTCADDASVDVGPAVCPIEERGACEGTLGALVNGGSVVCAGNVSVVAPISGAGSSKVSPAIAAGSSGPLGTPARSRGVAMPRGPKNKAMPTSACILHDKIAVFVSKNRTPSIVCTMRPKFVARIESASAGSQRTFTVGVGVALPPDTSCAKDALWLEQRA